MNNVIFLDIDGVLNTYYTTDMCGHFIGVQSDLLDNLAKLVNEFKTKIVLISTWREDWDMNPKKCAKPGVYLNDKFAEHGIKIDDKITKSPRGTFFRGLEIKTYIEEHNVDRFVIIDDEYFDYNKENLTKRLVHTSMDNGFDEKALGDAYMILFGVPNKEHPIEEHIPANDYFSR